MQTVPPRRKRRWLPVLGAALALVLGAAFALLRWKFEGAELGDNIASILNKRMRGRIAIGAVEWSSSSLATAITGGWIPLTLRGVRVWDDCALSAASAEAEALRTRDPNQDCTPDDRPDPDPRSRRQPRKLLLRTELITLELDAHALMFGNHDFVFRDVRIHGGEALIEETKEPYPLHAYNRKIVSIITAFYPRMKAGFRAGITADVPPPTFDLRDIHIDDLNLTLHMAPSAGPTPDQIRYAFAARFEGVRVDLDGRPADRSYLYADPTDPLIAKLYFRLALNARHATVRMLDDGPRSAFRLPPPAPPGPPLPGAPATDPFRGRSPLYAIELTDVRVDRLAQLPTDWTRHNVVANTLEVDATARSVPCATAGGPAPDAKDGADLHLFGELFNYWDRPYDGAWNFQLAVKNLGPTVRTCIQPMVGGDHLEGTISATGPFVTQPALGLDLTGVDLDIPLRRNQDPLRLTVAELHGKIDLVNEEGYIEQTKARVRGGSEPGEVELRASFGLRPLTADALVEIVRPIDVGRFLPPTISTSIGRLVSGRLRVVSAPVPEPTPGRDTMVALNDFDLTLGKTGRDRALRLHHGRLFTDDRFGSIRVEKVYLEAGESHAMFDGKIDVVRNDLDLSIDGNFPDLGAWLARLGVPAFAKSAGGGVIRLTGQLTSPTVTVSDLVLSGVPCIDKLELVRLTRAGDVVDVREVRSPGLGGSLSGTGRVVLGGRLPRIERLELTGTKLDAAKLCGLKGSVRGTIDELAVKLRGELDPQRPPLGWLTLGEAYLRADRLAVRDDAYSGVAACVNRKDDARCDASLPAGLADDLARCADGKRASAAGAGGFCVVASARRDAGGTLGAVIAQLPATRKAGKPAEPARLGGVIALADLPLAIVDQLRGATGAPTVGGLVSATLHLAGTPAAPQARGAIHLLRSWLHSGFIGDATIELQPTTIDGLPGLAFHGDALAGRLAIAGTIGTVAPFPLELTVTGHRVELDPFVDVQAALGLADPVQAWATGEISVRAELGTPTAAPALWVTLTELTAQISHRGSDGRVTPVIVRARDQAPGQRPAVSIYAVPTDVGVAIELACRDPRAPGGRRPCPSVLDTPAGDVVLEGRATPAAVAIDAHGDLDLARLAPLLDQRFDKVSGSVRLLAHVAGTLARPELEVSLDLDPEQVFAANDRERTARADAVRAKRARAAQALRGNPVTLRPIGADTEIIAPRGLIKLTNCRAELGNCRTGTLAVGFTNVLIQVDNPRNADDAGALAVAGTLELAALAPVRWALLLSGKIPGKILAVALPTKLAQAAGAIAIEDQLVIQGAGATPQITGTLALERLAVIPRGLRRELTFHTGTIELTTERDGDQRAYAIELADVTGAVDDGKLPRIVGGLAFRVSDREITRAAIAIDATSLPFRIPGSLDLALSASDVQIRRASPSAPWRVTGALTVIDGTYVRNFEITDRLQAIGVNTAPSRPFWEDYPALAQAELDLSLAVQLFAVRSNLGTVEFHSDRLQLSSTPRDPRLTGQIQVTHGELSIPGTRAKFTRTRGRVDFVDTQPPGSPDLQLTSEADYRDLSGQDHVITLSIQGNLPQLTWDLRTSTGYNQSQTLALLFFGRNPEQLRRSLGDQSLGGDPTRVDPTTNPSQGFADQLVKDVAGDWVSDLLANSLTKLTGLDVLRIEIGFGSIGFHVEKGLFDKLRLLGNAEQTIRGTTIKARAELKTPFVVSLQGGYLSQNYYDPAEQSIQGWDLKLVYQLFIP